MNAYYQAVGRHQWNCDFRDSGLVALTDPSIPITLGTGAWQSQGRGDMLQSNIDFACNYVDCSLIRFGGACHCPDSLINHASVVMNLYYQATGRDNPSCDFNNTGLTVMKDPSYGDCKYKFQQ
ncbi:Glucan endo-1,3-beta-glucosidase [Morella rubra]|uniref:Glucan endo-1,3-beta-glucosidase n=1 Tax=Morella rubra TaxID=262757 RepID=A0A6A1WBL1_9ROSI|nr:Glucan endo-1,3-beta-glucosidase [Morella rubra]